MRLRWPRACGRLYGARATGGSMARRSGQIGRLHESPDPLGERCALVMREALAALGTLRSGPSQVVERSRPVRISVVFEPRPPD